MFPLAGKTFPADSEQLKQAIGGALAEVFALPKADSAVKVDGARFPNLKQIKVNLNGATVSLDEPPPQPKPSGKRQPGIQVNDLEISGKPIKYEQNKLDLSLKARDVKFDFARDKSGQPLLVLTDAADGRVEAKISKDDIKSLATTAARELGKQQKINIQDLDLDVTSQGARSIAVDARIKASKLLVSGVIHITGRLDIDDALVATVSDLQATGEGAIGTLAAGIVQSKLKPFNGKKIPLMAFSLGDVALRDLKIAVKNSVQVTAQFGH